jgi:hypothetical protein
MTGSVTGIPVVQYITGFLIVRQKLSPRKNFSLLTEAFLGPRSARNKHKDSVSAPISVQSGLAALRERWPDLQSPSKSTPIFIFSAGWRSGSTFLQRWVMTDDNVMVWGEPYRHADVISSLARQLKAFTSTWPKDHFFVNHYATTSDLTQVWTANMYPSLANFMGAHINFLEQLFYEPALALGKPRWGLKEVTLDVNHACYLQWLFPNAKFLFLYRNPFDAYASYRKWRSWYKTWPNEPVFTATRFGSVWKELADDFVENHHKVGGLLLRYEELRTEATRSRLEDYLGIPLAEAASLACVGGSGADSTHGQSNYWVPKLESFLLKRKIDPVNKKLGYHRN